MRLCLLSNAPRCYNTCPIPPFVRPPRCHHLHRGGAQKEKRLGWRHLVLNARIKGGKRGKRGKADKKGTSCSCVLHSAASTLTFTCLGGLSSKFSELATFPLTPCLEQSQLQNPILPSGVVVVVVLGIPQRPLKVGISVDCSTPVMS